MKCGKLKNVKEEGTLFLRNDLFYLLKILLFNKSEIQDRYLLYSDSDGIFIKKNPNLFIYKWFSIDVNYDFFINSYYSQ